MTAGDGSVEPVLVLGLGNSLLGDDDAGLQILEILRRTFEGTDGIEFVDGGTQGLALLGLIGGRRFLLVTDAVRLGSAPGSIHVLGRGELERFRAAGGVGTGHDTNALELLGAAELLGDLPDDVMVVGIEPERIRVGIGLSDPVAAAIGPAAERAAEILRTAWRPLADARGSEVTYRAAAVRERWERR